MTEWCREQRYKFGVSLPRSIINRWFISLDKILCADLTLTVMLTYLHHSHEACAAMSLRGNPRREIYVLTQAGCVRSPASLDYARLPVIVVH